MQEKLYLAVTNKRTGDHYVTACTLPAQIGRQHESNNQVLLDCMDKKISRVHGIIKLTDRGYAYSDSSARGSRVGGLEVRDKSVPLNDHFQIEIENFVISPVEVTPIIIVHTDDRLAMLQQVELLPGRGVGVSASRSAALIDLNRWTEWGKPVHGYFEIVDDRPAWVQPPGSKAKASRNKSPVTHQRTLLESLDVIEIPGHRFELLHPHEGRIVCGNQACHLLNPPPLAGNCRYCGRDLAGTGGFSRVL